MFVVISFDPHLGAMRQSRKWDSHFTDRGTEAWEGCDLPRPPGEDRAASDDNPGLLTSPAGLFALITATVDRVYLVPGIAINSWHIIHSAITTALCSSYGH